MTEHEHRQHEEHGHKRDRPTQHKRKGLHKDWRLWAAVMLMLAAMLAYLLTMDESLEPGDPRQGPIRPAAPAL